MSSVKCTTIPQSRISRTHRVEIPASMNIFKLPRIGPKTGKLSPKLFDEVNKCVDEYTTSISGIKGGRCDGKTFLQNHGKKAVVQSKSTGKKHYKPEKRNCRKITSKELTQALSPLLEKQFRSVFGDEVLETRIHPEHCDLLFYEEGDFFNFHRDKILRFPFTRDVYCGYKAPKFCGMDVPAHIAGANRDNYMYRASGGEWHMYSVILCLDSNLKSQSLRDDGNTVVCLPSSSFLQNKKMLEYHFSDMINYDNVLNPTSYDVMSKKKLVHHVFHQSVTPGNFVIFPSSALHSSTAITQLGGYKYVLKMDLWVLIPPAQDQLTMYSDLLQNLVNIKNTPSKVDAKYLYGPGFLVCQEVEEMGKKRCDCKLCNPRPVEVHHIYQNLSAYFKNTLHPNIWSVIAEFLTIKEIEKPFYPIPDSTLAYTTRLNGDEKTFDQVVSDLLGPAKIDIKHVFQSPTGFDLDFMDWDTKKTGFPVQKHGKAADVALSLALTGKLFTQRIGNYYDYYDYLKSKNPIPRHQRCECICNRISTPENLEDTINEFKVTTCECTCVGCYIECMGVRGRYTSNDEYSDYYDDDDDCNEHSDFEYD